MAILKLKIDNNSIHLRIFDEKNEVLAEIAGKPSEHKVALAEIGRCYSQAFQGLRDLIFFLENPKSLIDGIKLGYAITRDR
jgi:hypothetical protein